MKSKKLGEIINIIDKKNSDNLDLDVLGVGKDKIFFPTIADLKDVNTSKYKIIKENYFACKLMSVGRDWFLPISLNIEKSNYLISPAYKTFQLKEDSNLNPGYLMLLFQNIEFDRYLGFISSGGIRGELSMDRFLEVDIPLPSNDEVQENIGKTWISIRKNINQIEQKIFNSEKLIKNYFAYLSQKHDLQKIVNFIKLSEDRNSNNIYCDKDVKSLSITKAFIDSSKKIKEDVSKYSIVKSKEFAFIPVTSRNGEKISISYNKSDPILVSNTYPVFKIINSNLIPEYLHAWVSRSEFDRYARYHSWGTAREVFNFDNMENVEIPIASLEEQQNIVNISNNIDKLKKLRENYLSYISKFSQITFSGIKLNRL